jgi:hypothetical protein
LKKIIILIVILIVAGFCFHSYEQQNKDVVAYVGTLKITKSDLVSDMNFMGGKQAHLINKQKFLEQMISEKLLLNKAYALNLEQTEEFKRECEAILKAKVRKAFIEDEFNKIKLEDKDFMDYYKKHKEDFVKPQKRQFAILFFKKHKMNTEQRKQEVHKKFTEIIKLHQQNKLGDAKSGFGSHSISNSEHQVSRYRGGIIGWFRLQDGVIWEKNVLDAGFKLKKAGDLSQIIETDKGYYLIRLADLKEKSYSPFDKVKGKIRHKLIISRQNAIKDSFDKKLRQEFAIKVNLQNLQEMNIDKSSVPKIVVNSVPKLPFN